MIPWFSRKCLGTLKYQAIESPLVTGVIQFRSWISIYSRVMTITALNHKGCLCHRALRSVLGLKVNLRAKMMATIRRIRKRDRITS